MMHKAENKYEVGKVVDEEEAIKSYFKQTYSNEL
jgi:hypothetical protein